MSVFPHGSRQQEAGRLSQQEEARVAEQEETGRSLECTAFARLLRDGVALLRPSRSCLTRSQLWWIPPAEKHYQRMKTRLPHCELLCYHGWRSRSCCPCGACFVIGGSVSLLSMYRCGSTVGLVHEVVLVCIPMCLFVHEVRFLCIWLCVPL